MHSRVHICVKCRCEMRCSKTGGLVRWSKTRLQSGDAYRCPKCETEVMVLAAESFDSKADVEEYVDMQPYPEISLPVTILRIVKEATPAAPANLVRIKLRLLRVLREHNFDHPAEDWRVAEILDGYVAGGVMTLDDTGYHYVG